MTLLLYQRWKSTRRWSWYTACVLAFVAAALAKPAVVTLPALLVLYDYAFVDGRLRLLDKLPFLVVALLLSAAAIGAHAAVAAVHPPHGGNLLAHLLMISRVVFEYVNAVFVPVGLSPIYYYPRSVVYAPVNALALLLIPFVCAAVTLRRRRYPWSFVCLSWFLLMLLPESNLVPLAQLRADRFLYLPMVAFVLWVAAGLQYMARSRDHGGWRLGTCVVAVAITAVLAFRTYTSAAVWRDNVSAWTRVVERHPWCARAHGMLGRAYYARQDYARAERALTESTRLSADVPDAHLYLAKVYAERGQHELAWARAHRFLELAPGDAEGLRLLSSLRQGNGS